METLILWFNNEETGKRWTTNGIFDLIMKKQEKDEQRMEYLNTIIKPKLSKLVFRYQ